MTVAVISRILQWADDELPSFRWLLQVGACQCLDWGKPCMWFPAVETRYLPFQVGGQLRPQRAVEHRVTPAQALCAPELFYGALKITVKACLLEAIAVLFNSANPITLLSLILFSANDAMLSLPEVRAGACSTRGQGLEGPGADLLMIGVPSPHGVTPAEAICLTPAHDRVTEIIRIIQRTEDALSNL